MRVGRLIIVAAAVALVCASTALAGNWGTGARAKVRRPKGLSADEPWVVSITALQHGLEVSQPLSLSEADGDAIRRVARVARRARLSRSR